MKTTEGLLAKPVAVPAALSGDAFRPVLLSPAPQQDSELADLIEQDGRDRLDRGLSCGLDRYYSAVPDLIAKPVALDAAIDISLRALAKSDGCASPQEKHAEWLLRSYPELSGPIRLAALLGNQLVTTTGVSAGMPRRKRSYPERIGALLEDGKPRYELLRPLGRGSSGTVCEAIDHLLSDSGHAAKVAVKLIPVDPASAQRQTAEATKARRVEHPGVVRVLDRGLTESDELYLVYELVPGGDLQAWFEERGKKITDREAAKLVAAIASGVQAAHSAGLVHCDLKPSNVLMDKGGVPRVSDFGVSAITDAFPGMAGASDGVPVGNLAFAAPEQVRRSAIYASPLVDIYALGGILFYLLTGTLPNGTTPEEVARNHNPTEGRQAPPSVRAATADLDERLDCICAKALHPRADMRYATAAELSSDLHAWLERRPIPWMRQSAKGRFGLWLRRSPATAAMLGGIVGVLVLGGFVSGFFANRARAEHVRMVAVDRTNDSFIQMYEEILAFLDTDEGKKMNCEQQIAYFFRVLQNRVVLHPELVLPPARTPNAPAIKP